jgi:hypothetical protein
MSDRREVYGGFVMGPDGAPHNVLASFSGPDTYIADNTGQTADQFWQQHNHYRTGGWDGGGGNRGHYTGPGA